MTYRDKRVRFTRMIVGLLDYANSLGYEVALKFVYRCPDCPVGKKNSLHKQALAADVDLYIDGEYQREGGPHSPLHDWWDERGGEPRLPWDMNHYAYTGREVQ